MTSWDYRVVREAFENGEVEYSIREFYWEQPDKLGPDWTAEPIAARGSSPKELRKDLERMLKALDHRIRDHDTGHEVTGKQ